MARFYFKPETCMKRQKLHRSFDTLEQANTFAAGKVDAEVYRSKGRLVVEWFKETEYPLSAVRTVIDPNTNKVKHIINGKVYKGE